MKTFSSVYSANLANKISNTDEQPCSKTEEIKVELKNEEEKLNRDNSKIITVNHGNDSCTSKSTSITSAESHTSSQVNY